MPVKAPRILIADDHAPLRERVTRLLTPAYQVVGSVGDGLQLLASAEQLHPQAVVVDLDMPRMTGSQAIRELRARGDATPIVAISVTEDPDVVRHVLDTGANAFVFKSRLVPDLPIALTAVLQQDSFVSTSRRRKGPSS